VIVVRRGLRFALLKVFDKWKLHVIILGL
jgi:hypothetical protein